MLAAVIGRYAPTPSGALHLGNARTALLAWLQARAVDGRVLLRIDDLDRGRSRPEHEHSIRSDLDWLGLVFDGEQQRPSARSATYEAALTRLIDRDLVYPCFCTRAEVRAAASAPHGADPRYPGTCADLPAAAAAGRPVRAYRFRVPTSPVVLDDLVHGRVVEDVAATSGDFVVAGPAGAAYQLACAIDDADDGITHVLRGDDLLASAARQVLVQRALGLRSPVYAHVPLMRDESGARLAKRDGVAGLAAARRAGRTPADVVGALAASVGLARPGEHVLPDALIARFDIGAVRGAR